MRRAALAAVAAGTAGIVIGWYVIGGRLAESLQTEPPGSRGYDEYTFMRDAAPWAGAAIGLGAAIAVASLVGGATSLAGRRQARLARRETDTAT